MDMTDFIKGRGPIKTTQDIINAAKKIRFLYQVCASVRPPLLLVGKIVRYIAIAVGIGAFKERFRFSKRKECVKNWGVSKDMSLSMDIWTKERREKRTERRRDEGTKR